MSMAPSLRPFFSFFGGKWRSAPHYPKPIYDTIIEPFAGSAGYSVRYADRKVLLIERDPRIGLVWCYLTSVKPSEVLALPDIKPGQSVDDLHVNEEARLLIGWWLNAGNTHPCKSPSSWMRHSKENGGALHWGPRVRARLASQVERIQHWRVVVGTDYTVAPDIKATWFIDPPYANAAGARYRYHDVNYRQLARWCRSRKGQVIVCENEGATWLPFEPFKVAKGMGGKGRSGVSREVIWLGGRI